VFLLAVFLVLVVAADPAFFSNNQPIVKAIVFWRLRHGGVAGWLWSKPQAVP
jgi:hypothetical protein